MTIGSSLSRYATSKPQLQPPHHAVPIREKKWYTYIDGNQKILNIQMIKDLLNREKACLEMKLRLLLRTSEVMDLGEEPTIFT